ncbi:hypothetical protein P7C73_g6693, partial [Tremellales sp. Uapishka_1]
MDGGGLPYDEPSPPPTSVEPSALDRALDDQPPAEIPDHVKSLMGRMGKGKVYLMEETPAILHLGGEGRVRDNPRIQKLAQQLDDQDPMPWLEAISATSPSPLRPLALLVRSDLIKHLSTSKVFSWTTGLGAEVMGIEWLNDETLLLLFPTTAATLLSLSILSKAGFDPAEGDDPLLERSAHSIPISLLPMAQPDPLDASAGQELLLEPTENTRRKGRGNFSSSSSSRFELDPLVPARQEENEWNLAPGVDPLARITIRYGVESDVALRKDAKASEWYKRHGRGAGKEVSSSGSRRRNEREEVNWGAREGNGEGRDFAKRIGRERKEPYSRSSGRERRKPTQEDLDRELDGIRNGDVSGDVDMDATSTSVSERRGGG